MLDALVPNSGVLAMVVVCTVVLSILTHGVTANPWAKAFGARGKIEWARRWFVDS